MNRIIGEYTIQQEIVRKGIHLTSIWIPITFYLFDNELMQSIYLIFAILFISFDLTRIAMNHYFPQFEKLFRRLPFYSVLRARERISFCGATYMLSAAYLFSLFLQKELFFLSFMILIISDSLAAIIGKLYGKRKIGHKTLEGSLAFLISSLMIIIAFICYNGDSKQYLLFAIGACLITTVAELYADALIDDNFLIPLSFSGSMILFETIFGT